MIAADIAARLARCPADVAASRALHDQVRADAGTGAPVTERGQSVLSSARPWEDLGDGAHIGECVCGTSLVFTLSEQTHDALARHHRDGAAMAAPAG
jgi:hypothetical protein